MKVSPTAICMSLMSVLVFGAPVEAAVSTSDLKTAEQSVLDHLENVAMGVTDWDTHCADFVVTTYPPFPLQDPQADSHYDPEENRIYVAVTAAGGYVTVKMSPSCV